MLDLDAATHADFDGCLHEAFILERDAGDEVSLALVEARARGEPVPEGRQPFSLLFRGPAEPVLPQCIYSLRHERLGSLAIFLVPVGPDADGMLYEAVFT